MNDFYYHKPLIHKILEYSKAFLEYLALKIQFDSDKIVTH